AVALDRFHIAGVRRRAVEYLGGPANPPHDFAQGRVVEVRQSRRRMRRTRQKKIPQAGGARFRLQGFDDAGGREWIAATAIRGDRFTICRVVRINVLIEELEQPLSQLMDFDAVFEFHWDPAVNALRASSAPGAATANAISASRPIEAVHSSTNPQRG